MKDKLIFPLSTGSGGSADTYTKAQINEMLNLKADNETLEEYTEQLRTDIDKKADLTYVEQSVNTVLSYVDDEIQASDERTDSKIESVTSNIPFIATVTGMVNGDTGAITVIQKNFTFESLKNMILSRRYIVFTLISVNGDMQVVTFPMSSCDISSTGSEITNVRFSSIFYRVVNDTPITMMFNVNINSDDTLTMDFINF